MDIVEGVSSFQTLMGWVVHDGGRKCIEAEEICHFTTRILQGTRGQVLVSGTRPRDKLFSTPAPCTRQLCPLAKWTQGGNTVVQGTAQSQAGQRAWMSGYITSNLCFLFSFAFVLIPGLTMLPRVALNSKD